LSGSVGQPFAKHRDRVVDVAGVDERARVRAAAPLAGGSSSVAWRAATIASAIRSCAISSSVRWCQASPNAGAISIARRHAASPSAALLAPAQQAAQVRQRLRALGELDAAPEGALRLVGSRARA
jgi:hypothetical protein